MGSSSESSTKLFLISVPLSTYCREDGEILRGFSGCSPVGPVVTVCTYIRALYARMRCKM